MNQRTRVESTAGVFGEISRPTIHAGPFTVTVAHLSPGLRLPPHAHECATLNVVLDGQYGEALERRALQLHGPATLIVKPSGTLHKNQIGSSLTECIVVSLAINANARGQQRMPVFGDVVVQRSEKVARCGGRLRAELARKDDLTALTVETLVTELLAEAVKACGAPPAAGVRWLDRVRELLHDEPGPQSLGDLAGRVERHPIYLARAFRAAFGCSVGEYARTIRVERARRLVHRSRLSLSQIAVCVGYSDQSHMTRDFKRSFNQTPGSYQRLIRGY